MANIKKNFNFRNGVQVDDDNLLVTATGLVGIGTTIPVESLDVRGNVIITGFTSATSANIGFLTVTTFEPTNIIGAGLSVKSGIVTATGTGILTYFGDASNLQGMPTSQWEDVDVGLGFTSIYNTGGNVGVGTEDPRSTVQVGGNVDAAQRGVGISSAGNINASGIITAASFVGDLTGNIVSGSTFSGNIDLNADLDVDGHTNLDNVSVTGFTTFFATGGTKFFTNIDAENGMDVTGLSTFAGGINLGDNDKIQFGNNQDAEIFHDASAGINDFRIIDKVGHLKLETATNKDVVLRTGVTTQTNLKAVATQGVELYFSGDKKLETASSGVNVVGTTTTGQLSVTGVSTFSQDVAVAGITTTKNLLVTGVTTFSGSVNATSIEVPNATITTKLGVGTTDTPVSDIQVTKSSLAEIQICSTGSVAQLNVGKEVGTGKTQTSQIRFGGGAGAPYSASGTSLDIINYDTGNFNYHLSGNNAAGVQGDFHWHKGINSARLMTLTGVGGSLGIGNTQPTKALDVTGAGNFTGDVNVGNNLIVNGLLLGNVQGSLTGNVSGTLAGNTNTTVGISTLNNLSVAGVATFTTAVETAAIGIGTTVAGQAVQINDTAAQRIVISSSGQIALKSDDILDDTDINAINASACFGGVGIGATVLKSAADFADAGSAGASGTRFMIAPKVTNTQRGNLAGVVSGAIVYNTSTNKLQVFNGSTWVNLH